MNSIQGTHIRMNDNCKTFVVEYPNGNVYHGEMKNGMRHGEGFMMYSRGGNYEGRWKNNRKHGEGIRNYKNGDVYRGNFRRGLRDGRGAYRWSGDTSYSDYLWSKNEPKKQIDKNIQ